MPHLLILGLGYTATRIAAAVEARGWTVTGTSRDGRAGTLPFDAAASAIRHATHILSSIPPAGDEDPVLVSYRHALVRSGAWLGYLSSTGVYGDSGGAWVDESAPVGRGRRSARAAADGKWLALGARVFRLPGIYGPGRSALDRVAEGRAHRIALPQQVFSRVHVDDIVSGVIAGFEGPPGAYNLADDHPCGQNAVIEAACDLLGLPWPVLQTLDEAGLSAAARGFYAENRRVANGKARRLLGWAPRYRDYAAGLRALSATTSPTNVSAQPIAD
ncbi:nucleoside-diphosphate-sugar epimerase [Sphingomonas zeicaulis]|uniref:SDR family NAD(P)-dependent oxidoreductase n=1 Tax=Sphingomonas zeicaulis TaxID=1632740 RepID=UPI003D249DA2